MSTEFSNLGLSSDANLKAYWKLENVNDSKDSYTLTNGGTTTFTSGKFNNAATFNGSSQYLYRGEDFGLSGASNNMSVSCWFKISSAPDTGVYECIVFFQTINGANRYFYRLYYANIGGVYKIHFQNRGYYDVTLSTDTWYHIGFTSNTSDNNIVYLNGTPIISTTASDNTSSGGLSDEFSLGASYYSSGSKGDYLNGQIDDVSLFDRELTGTEMRHIYTSSTPKIIII